MQGFVGINFQNSQITQVMRHSQREMDKKWKNSVIEKIFYLQSFDRILVICPGFYKFRSRRILLLYLKLRQYSSNNQMLWKVRQTRKILVISSTAVLECVSYLRFKVLWRKRKKDQNRHKKNWKSKSIKNELREIEWNLKKKISLNIID